VYTPLYSLHCALSRLAAGLPSENLLGILARVESNRGVVLKVGNAGRARIVSIGPALLVHRPATTRAVSDRLDAGSVHRDRLDISHMSSRAVRNLRTTCEV
jgi:hypothetical protein